MRYFLIFAILILFACQPAVRFTGDQNTGVPSSDNAGVDVVEDDFEALDKGLMGKIIAGYLRTPYKQGGTGRLGIDCSGLVYVVYRDYNGTRLPANTDRLFGNFRKVDYKNVRYGDLVFFSFDGTRVSHVGIYVGNDKFVHASKSRGVVISDITEDYYRSNYKGARRVFR